MAPSARSGRTDGANGTLAERNGQELPVKNICSVLA
jgi:hypothetical protein